MIRMRPSHSRWPAVLGVLLAVALWFGLLALVLRAIIRMAGR